VEQRRLIPLSGIAFVVLVLLDVIAFGGSTPASDSSPAKLVSYYDEHEGKQVLTAFVLAACVPLLALFGVYLASVLETASGASIWSRLLTLGTAVASAMILLAAFIHFALTDAANHVRGDGIRALAYLDGDGWIAWNAALGVMMLGAAGAVLAARRVLPRWLGWAALVLGIALFIPFADFFGLLLTLLWLAAVSIMLWRSERPEAIAAPQEA
jgi:hypothetical protein